MLDSQRKIRYILLQNQSKHLISYMLDKEFKYFLEHQDELVKRYNGRFIVIIGDNVIGDYSSEAEAYTETIKKHKPGNFLIQECLPGQAAYKQIFNSRVIFA